MASPRYSEPHGSSTLSLWLDEGLTRRFSEYEMVCRAKTGKRSVSSEIMRRALEELRGQDLSDADPGRGTLSATGSGAKRRLIFPAERLPSLDFQGLPSTAILYAALDRHLPRSVSVGPGDLRLPAGPATLTVDDDLLSRLRAAASCRSVTVSTLARQLLEQHRLF